MVSAQRASYAWSVAVFIVCGIVFLAVESFSQHAREGLFWLVITLTAFNPLSLFAARGHRFLALPALVVVWLGMTVCIANFGRPSKIVEWLWRAMTARFNLLQISVVGSSLLHGALTLILNVWPIILQNVPQLQQYKIQQDKPPASMSQWFHVYVHIGASQLLVQLPLITGLYFFLRYFDTPIDYDSMPSACQLAWRLVVALVVDDTWVYFGHRALHDRRIYKHIHKVHHTYTSPFAPDAEYEHPIETMFLGTGFFLACILLTNHLAFVWSWLYARLLVTYDSHSGYDLPLNIFRLMPYYNGAREHDWHHQYFNGNFAPTFTWWDQMFGTNAGYLAHEQKRLGKCS